jgi:hypothetical protein
MAEQAYNSIVDKLKTVAHQPVQVNMPNRPESSSKEKPRQSNKKSRARRFKTPILVAQSLPSYLDTFKVSKDLTELTEKHSISMGYLAHRFRLSVPLMAKMLGEPRPWEGLSLKDKIFYTRVHLVSRANDAELALLKAYSVTHSKKR